MKKTIFTALILIGFGMIYFHGHPSFAEEKHDHSSHEESHDEDDGEIPWQNSEEIAQAWPDAGFIKTRGLGHRRIIHDKKVISNIVKFLNDV